MCEIFKVCDYVKPELSDSDAIERCMYDASKISGDKTVIFDNRDYCIDRAILVSDNTEIYIDGCTIKQNDEVFDNVFRGTNVIVNEKDPYGVPIDVKPQKNIKIIGKNGAKIIGTSKTKIGYHPILQEEQMMNGDFWGWRTHMFSISLGENIEISGLTLLQTMGWAVSFDCGHDIYIHDLEIHSNVKNGDGIDFRSGCYNCVVENISGYTSDDTVACTALSSSVVSEYPVKNYLYPSEPFGCLARNYNRDIHNIIIKNISTGGLHHGVICLAARGNKVYDVTIENVHEKNDGQRESVVKIYTGYGDGYNAGDIHDISVKNITSESAEYTVQIVAEVQNNLLENIVQNNPCGELIFGAQEK